MATQYEPIVKDSTLNTTEQNPRNLADVLASGLANIANNVKPDGSDISIDVPGMSANNANDGFIELKQSLDNYESVTCTIANASGTSDCQIVVGDRIYKQNKTIYFAMTLKSGSNTSDINITLPSGMSFKQNGVIGFCGKGGRWSVTSIQYLYVGSNTLSINNITADTYYHILVTLPLV